MLNVQEKRRLLLIAPAFAPNAFSESIVNSKLALAFVRSGWDVTVVSRSYEGPAYHSQWQRPWIELKENTYEARYGIGGKVARTWDFIRSSFRLNFALPGIRWARRCLEVVEEMHARKPFDYVISRSPNDVGHAPALKFCIKTGVPWVANLNDPPAHIWPHPYTQDLGLFQGAVSRRFLDQVVRHANVMCFPSDRLRRYVLETSHSECSRSVVIPHIGLIGWEPKHTPRFDQFQMCHAGNLSKERDPNVLLRGFGEFLNQLENPQNVVLSIIGVSQPDLLGYVKRNGVEQNVKFLGPMAYLDTLSHLEMSDVLVLVEAPCKEGIFLPSKVVDYVQSQRPILALSPSEGTMGDLMSGDVGGVAIDCRDSHAVSLTMKRLWDYWKDGALATHFQVDRLWARFRAEAVISQYEEVFKRL